MNTLEQTNDLINEMRFLENSKETVSLEMYDGKLLQNIRIKSISLHEEWPERADAVLEYYPEGNTTPSKLNLFLVKKILS